MRGDASAALVPLARRGQAPVLAGAPQGLQLASVGSTPAALASLAGPGRARGRAVWAGPPLLRGCPAFQRPCRTSQWCFGCTVVQTGGRRVWIVRESGRRLPSAVLRGVAPGVVGARRPLTGRCAGGFARRVFGACGGFGWLGPVRRSRRGPPPVGRAPWARGPSRRWLPG